MVVRLVGRKHLKEQARAGVPRNLSLPIRVVIDKREWHVQCMPSRARGRPCISVHKICMLGVVGNSIVSRARAHAHLSHPDCRRVSRDDE